MQIRTRRVAALLGIAALAGCENELPTVTGEGGFPSDRIPVTVEMILPADQFLVSDTVYEGFEAPLDFLLVANRFDGALDAHALARFTGFPDSVVYSVGGAPRVDRTFTYGAGTVLARVDSSATRPRVATELELLPIVQAWDSVTVSWTNASDRPGAVVPWTTPGGTTGPAIARVTWNPGDGNQRDTLRWNIDSLTVARIARGEFQGLLVRPVTQGSRMEISGLAIDLNIRPAGRPDTVVTQRLDTGPQTFILNPEPPRAEGVFAVGGLTGARTVLRLDLSRRVRSCSNPTPGTPCPEVQLRDVVLNQATLLLDPAPVPSGYRPVAGTRLDVRQVLEPELGRRATLGAQVDTVTVPAAGFLTGTGPAGVFDISRLVVAAIVSGQQAVDLAVLTPPAREVANFNFGSLWFRRTPRLRLLYTVPTRAELP